MNQFCKDELDPQFHGIIGYRIQGSPTDSRTKPKSSPTSVGRDCIGKKTHVPHWVDKILGKSLYRGDNPHLMNRFCKVELNPQFRKYMYTIPVIEREKRRDKIKT